MLEQGARQLTYSAAPFDVGFPGNPVQSAVIENGVLTLQLSDHGIGFAQYAVRAMDDDGAQVATTLYVYVQPANDIPSATQMPDRYHSVAGSDRASPRWPSISGTSITTIRRPGPTSGTWRTRSIWITRSPIDNRAVFTVEPYVDEHDFLVYVPTDQPGFQGSAVVTITARDREGAEARLPDGTLPRFTVHVSNPSAAPYASLGGNETDGACAPACSAAGSEYAYPTSTYELPRQGLDAASSVGSSVLLDGSTNRSCRCALARHARAVFVASRSLTTERDSPAGHDGAGTAGPDRLGAAIARVAASHALRSEPG